MLVLQLVLLLLVGRRWQLRLRRRAAAATAAPPNAQVCQRDAALLQHVGRNETHEQQRVRHVATTRNALKCIQGHSVPLRGHGGQVLRNVHVRVIAQPRSDPGSSVELSHGVHAVLAVLLLLLLLLGVRILVLLLLLLLLWRVQGNDHTAHWAH